MPKKISLYRQLIAVTAVSLTMYGNSLSAAVITFEELSLGSPGDGSTAYGGPGGGYYWNGAGNPTPGSFTTGGASFINNYNSEWGSWDGFAYSNTTDTSTTGFTNQYSSITGGGAGGSTNYVVGYDTFATEWSITYSSGFDMTGGGLYATNTVYAYNSMLNGGPFGAKKFGGASGNDPDYFVLSITGWMGGSSTGVVDFYLADFRFSNNTLDYIVDEWTFVDLTDLGTVDKITFELSSSDVGDFGMNTPGYVAIDNVSTVPEPSTLLLMPCAILALALRRKRRCNPLA